MTKGSKTEFQREERSSLACDHDLETIFKAKCWMPSMELDADVEGESQRAEQCSKIGLIRVQ